MACCGPAVLVTCGPLIACGTATWQLVVVSLPNRMLLRVRLLVENVHESQHKFTCTLRPAGPNLTGRRSGHLLAPRSVASGKAAQPCCQSLA